MLLCMTIVFSMLPNHHITHQANDKVGRQPGDVDGHLIFLRFVWVCMG